MRWKTSVPRTLVTRPFGATYVAIPLVATVVGLTKRPVQTVICNLASSSLTSGTRPDRRKAIELALQPVVLDRYALALEVAGFVEALAERGGKGRIGRPGIDESDDRHRRLLRARRERPRHCRATEQHDELATFHSITSSASNCIELGTVSPSAFAVLRLITSSNLVGCTTGKSAGLAPLRMRPA